MLFLASCEMKNELTGSLTDKVDTGALELGVSVKQPVSHTRADVSGIDTNTFPIEIKGTSEGVDTIVRRYNTLAEMPASISVPVGTYSISSHTPGELQKQMTSPYYAGDTKATVSKDITSTIDVVCRMANSRIEMDYGDDFKEAFSEWTITIDDGSEMALSYTQDNQSPEAVYWYFGDNVDAIKVNITAKTTEGNTVSQRQTFRKADASENYDDVSDNFVGGDALQIEMGAVESATGTVTGVTIHAHITFEDESEAVEIPTTGEDTGEQPDSNEPDNPSEPGEAISISEPDGNSYLTDGVDLAYGTTNYPEKEVVVNMAVKDGIKNVFVKVSTTDETFESAAEIMGLTSGDGLDLASDAAADLSSLFALPGVGDTKYRFTLNETLLGLLMNTPGYKGKHEFTLTVIDQNDQQKSATLTIQVN